MSDKRNGNRPKPESPPEVAVDAELLETEDLNPSGLEGPARRGGDRESHHASAQPRPIRPRKGQA
jgi:hypothetical protein